MATADDEFTLVDEVNPPLQVVITESPRPETPRPETPRSPQPEPSRAVVTSAKADVDSFLRSKNVTDRVMLIIHQRHSAERQDALTYMHGWQCTKRHLVPVATFPPEMHICSLPNIGRVGYEAMDEIDAVLRRLNSKAGDETMWFLAGVDAGTVFAAPAGPDEKNPGAARSAIALLERKAIEPRPAATNDKKRILSVEYGYADVKNKATLEAALKSLVNPDTPFHVNNETMGGDPLYGTVKKCIVRYSIDGVERCRTAMEHETIDFNWEILDITYGGKKITHPAPYAAALESLLDPEVPFLVSNDTFRGDPLYGVVKTCEITVRYGDGTTAVKKGTENEFLSLEQDVDREIKHIRYHNTSIYDRAVYSRVYAAIQDDSAHFRVWSDTLGCDPAYGVVKTCTITIQRRDGEIVEVSGRDGDILDFEDI